ncbi:MAG: ABC transporter ATP-binding protein [Pseudonocardiaceae bacterium]
MSGRPGVAEFLEERLRASPGVGVVQANPVTGRLLICHDTTLSRQEVDQLVRSAVALVVVRIRALTRSVGQSGVSKPGVVRVQHRRHVGRSVAVAGGAAVVVVLARRAGLLGWSPLVGLGGVVLATVVVIRGAWRRSRRSQEDLTVSSRSTRHPLLRIVGSHRRRFYLASFFSILGQILEMTPLALIGWMIVVLATGKSAALVRLGLVSVSGQLWFIAGATTLAFVGGVAMSSIAGVLWRNLAQSVQHEWRTEMYAHVQRVELRYLEGERTTRLARVLTDDINQLGHFFAISAHNLLQLGTGFAVLIPVFLFFAPGIAWIAFLPVPIMVWLSFSHRERTAPDYAAVSEHGSRLNSQLTNNLEASATVKSFGAEKYEIDRIYRLSEAYSQGNRRIDKRAVVYNESARLCAMVSLAGVLGVGSQAVLNGALSFNVFNILAFLPTLIIFKLPVLGDAVGQYQQTVAALGRVLDLRSLPVEPDSTGQRLDVANVRGEMVLDGVTFAYPGRSPVLHNLSLRFASGKTTGIVGVTGAGKTTITKLLLRFQDVESGRVLLDGLDIRYLRLNDLRNAIGFVGQDPFLFDGTVEDNIRYGSFDASPRQLVDAAQIAEADGFVQALPLRYDTMVGERGVTLSGGQKQRIALARAILKNAPIFVLDEATSALDNETEVAIHRALADFARNRTLIIIAHRLSTIRHADWIYVIGDGIVLEQGTHHQLLQHHGMYAYLWRLQIGEARL